MRKFALHFLNLSTAILFLAACGGGSSDYNPEIGPFDANGNYVEAWADNPPKKGRSRSKSKKTEVAKESWSERKARVKRERKAKQQLEEKERLLAKEKKEEQRRKAKEAQQKKESWSARNRRLKQERLDKIQREKDEQLLAQKKTAEAFEKKKRDSLHRQQWQRKQEQLRRDAAEKKRLAARAKPTPKPSPKPVKVAPRFRYHRVSKSDTLWGLSKKYGTSVTTIKRANRLRGNTILTGSTLKIPR